MTRRRVIQPCSNTLVRPFFSTSFCVPSLSVVPGHSRSSELSEEAAIVERMARRTRGLLFAFIGTARSAFLGAQQAHAIHQGRSSVAGVHTAAISAAVPPFARQPQPASEQERQEPRQSASRAGQAREPPVSPRSGAHIQEADTDHEREPRAQARRPQPRREWPQWSIHR